MRLLDHLRDFLDALGNLVADYRLFIDRAGNFVDAGIGLSHCGVRGLQVLQHDIYLLRTRCERPKAIPDRVFNID